MSVGDPAAYLHDRVNTLLEVVNHDLYREHWRFEEFSFEIDDAHDGVALMYDSFTSPGGSGYNAYARRDLVPCALHIDLDIEFDYQGPPCHA